MDSSKMLLDGEVLCGLFKLVWLLGGTLVCACVWFGKGLLGITIYQDCVWVRSFSSLC